MLEREFIMFKDDLDLHEECKQLSSYSYDINKRTLPTGHSLVGVDSFEKTGFFF